MEFGVDWHADTWAPQISWQSYNPLDSKQSTCLLALISIYTYSIIVDIHIL